jgi:hypothetical protein
VKGKDMLFTLEQDNSTPLGGNEFLKMPPSGFTVAFRKSAKFRE